MKKDNFMNRAIILELWLINNYELMQEDNWESILASMNFSLRDITYLIIAYKMPYAEINDMIVNYDKGKNIDELELICDLEKRYNATQEEVIQRIRFVRKINKSNVLPLATIYNKLVRDEIPSIIAKNGDIAIWDTLSKEEYLEYLFKKDEEELEEVKRAQTKQEVKEELADKLEVLSAISKYYGFTLDDIKDEAIDKRNKKGGFDKQLILKRTYRGKNDKS